MKRLLDITIALALVPVALPVMAISLLVLAVEMRANPLFSQTRIGRYRKPFTIYKLRTMRPGTRNAASHEVAPDTITAFGGFLRKAKLDEIPQIYNVLVGEMSFVGPRPCLPQQSELIDARDALGLYGLRPGITGPAQLKGIDMSNPVKLAQADAAYLRDPSIAKDIALIARTFLGFGSGDAARPAER